MNSRKFDIHEYMEKYAALSSSKSRNSWKIDKNWARKGSDPFVLGGKKRKKKLPNVDPGFIFLNSGRFAQLMMPKDSPKPQVVKMQPEPEQLVDLLGNVINRRELFS